MTDSPDQDTPRDDKTFSMFGDPDGQTDTGYVVLARKYRPRRFEDLVGQDAMVRTLSNAFRIGRIAHAFMLTGVRGVGKTTTARLLARALNYETESHSGPSVTLEPLGRHCQSIMESRHPDVLELDAASRTGVSDMRELLDSVKYAPVSATYKVYIIDEVHMLSNAAFNALLKTLEEPPPHVKFVFATTEIRKVPVTVLSRCQRFDLKRLDVETLADHLGSVASAERADIEREALELIARAAEGSVRDGLSILDQAIVQRTEDEAVSAETVRAMLGLADRGRLLDLYHLALKSDLKGMLGELTDQVTNGAEPMVLFRDLMDVTVDLSRAIALGDGFTIPGPTDWVTRTKALASGLSHGQTGRFWQILQYGFEQAGKTPDPGTALEMTLIRLATAASLPSPEDAARMLREGGAPTERTPSASPSPEGAPEPSGPVSVATYQDVLALLLRRKKADLHYDCERYIRPDAMGEGTLAYDLVEGAPDGVVQRLKAFLDHETGRSWTFRNRASTAETVRESKERAHRERIDRAKDHPMVQKALEAFPGAEVLDVVEPDTTVVEVDFTINREAKGQKTS